MISWCNYSLKLKSMVGTLLIRDCHIRCPRAEVNKGQAFSINPPIREAEEVPQRDHLSNRKLDANTGELVAAVSSFLVQPLGRQKQDYTANGTTKSPISTSP